MSLEPFDLRKLSVLLALVAADRQHTARAVFKMLRVAGVQQAQDAAAVHAALKAGGTDVVFIDCGTPEAIGLMRELRQAGNTLPLIAVLVSPVLRDVEQARDAGATDVISWPLSVSIIERKLQRSLSSQRAFIAAQTFSGPDRRNRDLPFDSERRGAKPVS